MGMIPASYLLYYPSYTIISSFIAETKIKLIAPTRTILGICLTCLAKEKSSHRQQIASLLTRSRRLRNYSKEREFRDSLYASPG